MGYKGAAQDRGHPKKTWMGSTKKYDPFRLLIDAPQMRHYHEILFFRRRLQLQRSAKTNLHQRQQIFRQSGADAVLT
jgi:hypothetical protein